MQIGNVHERKISVSASEVGVLLDSPASAEDKMWPHENWPKIKFDRSLEIGAVGGHGPIRYSIESYTPGKNIRFKFARDFDGYHELVIEEIDKNSCLLRHSIKATASAKIFIRWFVIIRPLHNTLVEDLFDKVEQEVLSNPKSRVWSLWVKALRKVRKAPAHNVLLETRKPMKCLVVTNLVVWFSCHAQRLV